MFSGIALPAGTAAARSSGETARASVADGRITVAGTPFFPIMMIDLCRVEDVAHARKLGINLIVNESCPDVSPSRQLAAAGSNPLAVLPIASRDVRGRTLAGWAFPDEPEGNGWTPDTLRRAHPFPRGGTDGLLSFLTTGGGFYRSAYTHSTVAADTYGQFARLADVAGFDLYPLGHCSPDLGAVYAAQRAFNTLAGAMPTFQWIETGPIRPSYCGGFRMTSAELAAEVWLAVAGGARGIGYFTHTWTPAHHALDVRAPVARAIVRTNSLLTALRPALLGKTVASSVDTTSVKVIARRSGRTTYLIAVNAARSPLHAQLDVPLMENGTVRVFAEHRTVSASNGRIDDSFAPLAVHVYVQTSRRG